MPYSLVNHALLTLPSTPRSQSISLLLSCCLSLNPLELCRRLKAFTSIHRQSKLCVTPMLRIPTMSESLYLIGIGMAASMTGHYRL